jgi:NodT family efflux transporter outer membrane factor (OMF) lipoprotein
MRYIPFLASAALVAGCTTVGPDYKSPAMETSGRWIEATSQGTVDPSWWNGFGDPLLVKLVRMAIRNSPTLRESSARLREARAARDEAFGRRRPEGGLSASATRNRLSENGQIPVGEIPGFEPGFSLFDVGFDAQWEVDLWGRQTRERESAEARVGAADAARDSVVVQITGELARAYFELRGAQAEIAAVGTRQAAEAKLAELSNLRVRHGEANRIESSNSIARARSTDALLAALRARAAGLAYSVALLAGAKPSEIVPELRVPAPIPEVPQSIATGLQSEFLRRRPDIRRAEREFAAATADIGVATADLFPRLSLLGGLQQQSRSVGGLFESGSTAFRLGPSLSWPVFSMGRVRARVRGAQARADSALARYEQAVVAALNDTERAANAVVEARLNIQSVEQSLEAQRESFRLAERRFTAGEDDRLAVEQARIALAEAERQLSQARAAAGREAASLYKEIGGAWQSVEARGE